MERCSADSHLLFNGVLKSVCYTLLFIHHCEM
jgi:hypothetical protein